MENENLKEETKEIIENELENSNREILGTNEIKEEQEQQEENTEKSKGMIFFKRILSGIIDQGISIAIALILLLVFNTVLKLIGFYVVDREPIFFIIYVITNILYTPICNSSKLEKTIGLKINFK